jgi:hypothetical protein
MREDAWLVGHLMEAYPLAPAETNAVLDMLKPLTTDLAFITSMNVLRQLDARFQPTTH